jgi:DNA-binding transcriptional LysR family regulator
MELRHLRYFVSVGEEEHYGRAAARLHLAQPALSRQIQDLENEIGFRLFERLPRGVKLSAAGKLFLTDARRILQEVEEAKLRAERVAKGMAGTLRVGFMETVSWHGVVPDSLRLFRKRQPDVELQLHAMRSLLQIEGVRSGRLDAGFIFSATRMDGDLAQRQVARYKTILAAPKGHSMTKRANVRLRDLQDVPFAWFSRWVNPSFYDGLMHACFRGGLKSPRIVQEAVDQAMTLSLVACRIGFAFVADEARWQCPRGVKLLPVVDLDFQIPIYLIWRKDNQSPLLQKFVAQVEALTERQ